MFNNPTLHKKSCRSQSAEKQAIRESMAPFAPFPGALKQNDKSVSRNSK
jgi:hypothetical protein